MRVLFIFPNNQKNYWRLPLGLSYLISVLERDGHDVNLYDTTSQGRESDSLDYKLKHFRPDIVCLSVMSTQLDLALKIAERVKSKSREIKVMFGGVHPTITKGDLLKSEYVDYVCLGEGEKSLSTFIKNNLKAGTSTDDIKGIWYKNGDEIVSSGYSELITDLDELPFPNRQIFDTRHTDNNNDGAPILTARGCPYLCTYCVNPIYTGIYGNKYIRFRKIEYVLKEMENVILNYNIDSFFIQDETFFMSKKRVLEFCDEYRRMIGMPFSCMGQVTQIDEEIIDSLKRAGCTRISLGVETGNETIRRQILKRNISDEQIKTVFNKCRQKGIRTHSFNIIGLPYETLNDVDKTLQLNIECKPSTIQFTIMAPFEGTKIRDTYKAEGWIVNDNIKSTYGDAMISMPQLTTRKLLYLQDVLPYRYYLNKHAFIKRFVQFIFKLPMNSGKLLIFKNLIKKALNRAYINNVA